MKIQHADLTPLGWSEWFEERAACGPDETVARVAAVARAMLLVMDQTGPVRAKLAGNVLPRHRSPPELPCVGDWVCVQRQPSDDFGLVRTLLERRTALRRRSAGDTVDYQMIAANVDHVIIVQSCHYDFNLNRLERYLVMVQDGGAGPCVLLTKTDLVEPDVLASQVSRIREAGVTAPILTLSNVTRQGIDDLKRMLLPARTYCLVGRRASARARSSTSSSAARGYQTKDVMPDRGGEHTTVRRELIVIEGGALVIDNPGMREFGILGAEGAIEDSFSGITRLASGCRYRDCSHTDEPGCAVREALDRGA
jgi:ribosome biogenesis GTPase